MTQDEKLNIEEQIVTMLRTVYDPEMPVNVYDMGLIYRIDVADDGNVAIDMTFTAPTCPMADFILEDVRIKVAGVEGVTGVDVQLVWEPAWNVDMMNDEAKLEMGLM